MNNFFELMDSLSFNAQEGSKLEREIFEQMRRLQALREEEARMAELAASLMPEGDMLQVTGSGLGLVRVERWPRGTVDVTIQGRCYSFPPAADEAEKGEDS